MIKGDCMFVGILSGKLKVQSNQSEYANLKRIVQSQTRELSFDSVSEVFRDKIINRKDYNLPFKDDENLGFSISYIIADDKRLAVQNLKRWCSMNFEHFVLFELNQL